MQTGDFSLFDESIQDILSLRDSGKLTGQQREFRSLAKGLTPEQIREAKNVELGITKRAGTEAAPQIFDIGGVPHIFDKVKQIAIPVEVEGQQVTTKTVSASESQIAGDKAAAQETAKLSAQLKLEPEVKAAVVAAVGQAKETLKQTERERSNDVAFNVYETAIANLTTALGGTITGPGAGFIPAITSSAQIANASVAMMAPVLKGIFRGAGEGTFTDQDQKLLLGLVPDRNTSPDAIVAQLTAIDALVRAKLERPAEQPQQEQIKQEAGQDAAVDDVSEGEFVINQTTGQRLQLVNGEFVEVK
jgi:hypothetical protein